MEMNIELKYQSIVTAENGTVEQVIKTPFGIDFSDIQQIFIDQTPEGSKRLSIYPNGCVVYMENTPKINIVKTNWPLKKEDNGDLVIVNPEQ